MISIVVLSYNHEKYIRETLDSVYDLKIAKEVIIIDDCSRDSSISIIENAINDHNAAEITHVIAKEKNSGLIDSLNIGLASAHYPYIYFIASDDVIDGQGFNSLLHSLQTNDKAHFAMGNAWVYYTQQPPVDIVYKNQHQAFFSSSDNLLREKIFTDFPKPLLLQATIFRTQALKDIGGWDKQLAWDDYPMFVKLFLSHSLNNGDFLFCIDEIVVKYRQHDTNAYKNISKQLRMVEEAMSRLAPENLYKKAISRQYAFYFLIAAKSRDVQSLKYITHKVFRERICLRTAFCVCKELFQWMQRKRK